MRTFPYPDLSLGTAMICPEPKTATRPHARGLSLDVRKLALIVLVAALACAPAAHAAHATSKTRLTITGAGFGHGIGMSQYGAYGYALHLQPYTAILAHYYTGTGLGALTANPEVKVLLQGSRSSVSFSGAVSAGGLHLGAGHTYTIRRKGAGLVIRTASGRAKGVTPGPLRIDPAAGQPLRLAGTSVPGVTNGLYRGSLVVSASGSGLIAVNALDLEDYVRGVVSAESPASWPAEALKAQAVAARTYALTSKAGGSQFDQYADTRSQVYRGVAAETPTTDAAVAATKGQVVTYQGRPVTTYFFSTSGGETENVENSFVGSSPKPWLKAVDDPFDSVSPKHRWRPLRYTQAQAQAKLGRLVKGRFRRVKVVRRGVSPRIVRAQVVGSRGRTSVTGPQLRKAFGLMDTWAYFTTVTSAPSRPRAAATPATLTGGVAPLLEAAALRTPRIRGAIQPATPGGWLRVERLSGRHWVTAADATVGAGGRYSVAVPGPGVYRVVYGEAVGAAVRVV
jgi:stage II sporulation protein D